jgi:hypothetical protein
MGWRGKKLHGNGLWEASRMMLPEHRSAIRKHRIKMQEQVKPEFDAQQIEEWGHLLREAYEYRLMISVTAYGIYGNEVHMGRIDQLNLLERSLKLVHPQEVVWISLDDILHVALHSKPTE